MDRKQRDHLGKPLFGSRQLKVAEMSGRAGAQKEKQKKYKTARKRNAEAADDQDFSKIARPQKRNFRPPRNERAVQKTPSPTEVMSSALVDTLSEIKYAHHCCITKNTTTKVSCNNTNLCA